MFQIEFEPKFAMETHTHQNDLASSISVNFDFLSLVVRISKLPEPKNKSHM